MMTGYMWPLGPVTIKMSDGAEKTSSQEHCIALMAALRGYAEVYEGATAPEDLKFAAGTKLDEKGTETMFVENKIDSTRIARVELMPRRCRASMANPALGNAIARVSDLDSVAPAIWFAYLQSQYGNSLKGNEFQSLIEEIVYGTDDADDFELKLTNFEARAITTVGPVTGDEKNLKVLDRRVEGPTKIICGVFETFPGVAAAMAGVAASCTRAEIQKFRLETKALEAYRKALRPEDIARIPERRDDYVFGEAAVHAFERASQTQNDPRDLAVKTFAFFGPPASGKSELATVFAELNGLPIRRQVFGKNSCWDDLMEQVVPYIVKGSLPSFTEEERLVNDALKEDAEGRDPVELAREALGFPATSLEVKFDPDSARAVLGEEFAGEDYMALNVELDSRAKAVLSSVSQKINAAGVGHEFLGFKTIISEFMEWFINGGVLEMSETSNANPAELSRLHDVLDFSKDCWLTTSSGSHRRNPCCYAILTNNTDGDENNPMTMPMLSRMAVPVFVPAASLDDATSRLCRTLGCEDKKVKAKQIVEAYLTLGAEARSLALPGDLDFRQLKQVGNMILNHGSDPKRVFGFEVIAHFTQSSAPENRQQDTDALLSVMDELELFR